MVNVMIFPKPNFAENIREMNPLICRHYDADPYGVWILYKLAAIVKKNFPNVYVLAGGTHPTVLPDEVMEDRNIDLIAISEAEHTMIDVYNVITQRAGMLLH